MKTYCFLLTLYCVNCSKAQKMFFFTGFDLKGVVMTNNTSLTQEARLINSTTKTEEGKKTAQKIASDIFNLNDPNVRQTLMLSTNLYFRPNSTKALLKWSELTVGLGFVPAQHYSNEFADIIYNYYASRDTAGYHMRREVRRHSGLIFESRFMINSSPYRGRWMKYAGIGIRAGLFQDKYNTLVTTTAHYGPTPYSGAVYDNNNYPLFNTSNSLLGIFCTLGLKYKLSCKLNLFTDLNFGHSNQYYSSKVRTDGFNFNFSFGIKYKMGNAPVPGESYAAPDDPKDTKRKKKYMQVQW